MKLLADLQSEGRSARSCYTFATERSFENCDPQKLKISPNERTNENEDELYGWLVDCERIPRERK